MLQNFQWLGETARRLRLLFLRRKVERENAEEMRLHLELRALEAQDSGLQAEEAGYAAQRRFGNVLRLREEMYDGAGWSWFDHLSRDLRQGARQLRKNPGFAAVAVLTLALGIGACTSIFSVLYGVLLAPLPYKEPSQLVVIQETTPKVGTVSASYPNFLDWRAQSRTFEQMAAVDRMGFALLGMSRPESIVGQAVSPNFLSMLGVHPMLGRDFQASEENPGAAPVALLSYEFWRSHFGSDPRVVGHPITLDDRAYAVVGVLPREFRSAEKMDVLVSIGAWAARSEEYKDRGERGDMTVIGRLASGASLERARAEMEGIAARLEKEYPSTNDQFGVSLEPLRDVLVGDMRFPVLVLFGAVVFVLLIACANVANLFLVRGASRGKEIALRVALGASRSRIVHQLLTEGLVLAFAGGLLGVALALVGVRGIERLMPEGMLMGASVKLNAPVFMFAAVATALSALIFGLAPAIQTAKPEAPAGLRESGKASSGAAQGRLRGILVVAEVSLALVLLAGAGLMIRSLFLLLSVDPGLRTDRVLTMRLSLRAAQYSKEPEMRNFWQQVLDRVRVLPGVESAAVGTVVPFTGDHSRSDITLENMVLPAPGSFPHPDVHIISPDYLSSLGIPLHRGRQFTGLDIENAPLVGLVNASVVRQYFPNQDPIGKRFMFGHPSKENRWITIVGVVGDTKLYGLASPSRLEIYVPFRQSPDNQMELVVKSGSDPAVLTSVIREAIAAVDKDQPVTDIAPLNQLFHDSIATRKLTFIMLGLFSALALVLAAIGIYGVISYAVAMRTREIGIRLALGAQRSDVLGMVISQGVRLALTGVVLGLLVALGLTRLMRTLLFGVSPTDPFTLAAVALLLTMVAFVACCIPARSAMRVEPVVALRCE